jgi:hypothetical protein
MILQVSLHILKNTYILILFYYIVLYYIFIYIHIYIYLSLYISPNNPKNIFCSHSHYRLVTRPTPPNAASPRRGRRGGRSSAARCRRGLGTKKGPPVTTGRFENRRKSIGKPRKTMEIRRKTLGKP